MSEWNELKRLMLPTAFGATSKRKETDDRQQQLTAFETTRRQSSLNELIEQKEIKQKYPGISNRSSLEEIVSMSDIDRFSDGLDNFEPDLLADHKDNSEDDNDEASAKNEDFSLPISHEIQLKGHTKAVSALDVDPSGSRILTGGHDYTLKFWDFHGMDAGLRPFRSVDPREGHQIVDLQWSGSGDQFLMATYSPQIKIYDRDGVVLTEFNRGDMYIRDLRHTAGHIGPITAVRWQPHQKQIFATASADSTIRIWDAQVKRKQKAIIIFKHGTGARGAQSRISVSSLSYSYDGKLLAGGAADGSVRIWNSDGPYVNAVMENDSAHMAGSTVTSLHFDIASHMLVTRGTDDTVKLWDIRKFKTPVHTRDNIYTTFDQCNAIISPDQQLVAAGVCCHKGETSGKLLFLNIHSFETTSIVELPGSSIRILWHPKINQILVGNSLGSTHVLYDPNVSVRGAKLCVAKPQRTKQVDDLSDLLEGRAANAMAVSGGHAFRDRQALNATGKVTKRQLEKIRKDPKATRAPEMPYRGPGAGGKIGESAQQAQLRGILKDTSRDMDPREAFLRHAQSAKEDPYWIAPAYKGTQPSHVLASSVLEAQELKDVIETEDKQRASGKRRRI